MKKSTLALAVAAALVGFGSTAYADTTLYGSARPSIDYTSINARGGGSFGAWDIVNNASRLGVRGEEELGGGLSAIYQYEFGVDMTEGGNLESNRPKWVGLKGDSWGAVTLGTQWTPYYSVVGIGDHFNSGASFDNNTYLGTRFGTRMDNSLLYKTPNWGGFGIEAMVVANGNAAGTRSLDVSDDVDMWNIGASYKNGPFFIGATYMAASNLTLNNIANIGDNDRDQWAVALGYNDAVFGVTAAYEDGTLNALSVNGNNDYQNYYVTGRYTFGGNTLRAAYGQMNDTDSSRDRDNWAVGYQVDLSKRTRIWTEYVQSDGKGGLPDTTTVSIGTRHDF